LQSLVRVPRVLAGAGGRLRPTQHVLCMELFEGTSLADCVRAEQQELACALGLGSGEELRLTLMRRVRAHFEGGGGSGDDGIGAELLLQAGVAVAPLLRALVAARRAMHVTLALGWNCGALAVRLLSLGHITPALRHMPRAASAVDLGRALHTLIHVHGVPPPRRIMN
jgi:hypothetical protein